VPLPSNRTKEETPPAYCRCQATAPVQTPKKRLRCRCQVMDPERTPKKTPSLHSNSNIYRRCRCPQNGPQRKRHRCIATAHRRLATCTQTRSASQPARFAFIYIEDCLHSRNEQRFLFSSNMDVLFTEETNHTPWFSMTTVESVFLRNAMFRILVWCSLNDDNDRPWNASIWLHYFPPVPVRPWRPGTILSHIIAHHRIIAFLCRLHHDWTHSPAIHVLNALCLLTD
jgi:hypothetical protein